MNETVQALNQSFGSFSLVSLGASLAWGILSVYLSPCHVASIPLIIGYVNKRKKPDLRASFVLSLLFGLGILSMLILMGVITGILGRMLGDVGTPLMIVVYIFLLVCGIWLLDLPVLGWLNVSFFKQNPRFDEMGAFTLGFLYGLILGPCSFAFLAPILGIVFTQSMTQLWFGIALFVFYAIGHTAAIVIAGTAGGRIVTLFESGNLQNLSLWVKRLCGSFIIVFSSINLWENLL